MNQASLCLRVTRPTDLGYKIFQALTSGTNQTTVELVFDIDENGGFLPDLT
jgi:hypothetical protein